jgi:hypothetical protein
VYLHVSGITTRSSEFHWSPNTFLLNWPFIESWCMCFFAQCSHYGHIAVLVTRLQRAALFTKPCPGQADESENRYSYNSAYMMMCFPIVRSPKEQSAGECGMFTCVVRDLVFRPRVSVFGCENMFLRGRNHKRKTRFQSFCFLLRRLEVNYSSTEINFI